MTAETDASTLPGVSTTCDSRTTIEREESAQDRGQSSVVGVALLLGATLVALGALTAGVGTIVDGHAARADAGRVASDLQRLRPVETTGYRTVDVRFTEGSLSTVERDLRVLESGTLLAEVEVDALVYERGDRRVRWVAGAVVRGRGEAAWTVDGPPVVGSRSNGVLVVGAPKLNTTGASVGGRQVTATLATNVSHERASLGTGEFAVAVETAAPVALEATFRERGATTVERRDIDSDGVPSVVATFPGTRTGYLVVHDMRLEVNDG